MREKFKSDAERIAFEEVIRVIEQAGNSAPLVSLHTLGDEKLARDLAVVEDDRLRVQVCRAQMKQHRDDFFYQAACLRRLAAILGPKAFADVAAALGEENEILRRAAITLATKPSLKALSRRWREELTKSKGVKRAAILEVLGKDEAN